MLSLLRSAVQYSVSNVTSFDRASFWLQEYMMTAGLLCCSSQSEVFNYHSVSEGNPSHNLTDNLFRGNKSRVTWGKAPPPHLTTNLRMPVGQSHD